MLPASEALTPIQPRDCVGEPLDQNRSLQHQTLPLQCTASSLGPVLVLMGHGRESAVGSLWCGYAPTWRYCTIRCSSACGGGTQERHCQPIVMRVRVRELHGLEEGLLSHTVQL
jgi:hypothetical protein